MIELFIFIVVKYLILRQGCIESIELALRTIGICLGQSTERNITSKLMYMWNICFLLFSIQSTALLSAIIYQKLIQDNSATSINTIEEVCASKIKINVPEFLINSGTWYSQLR